MQGTFCADAEEEIMKPSFIFILLSHRGFFCFVFFFQTIAVCAVNAAISKCGKIKKMQLGFSCYLHVCLGLRMILLRSHLGSFYKLFLYLVIHVSSKFSYIKCYGHLELLFFL